MKNFLLIVVILLSLKGQAQTYQRIFEGKKHTWNVLQEVFDMWITYDYESGNDTIFRGRVYHTIKEIKDFWFMEDIDGRSLLALPAGQDTFGLVIMNMELDVNDTFKFFHWSYLGNLEQHTAIVDSVWHAESRKIIQFNYVIHSRYDSLGRHDEKLRFIEGIGPNIGLFFNTKQNVFPFPSSYLLCATVDSETVYKNNLYQGQCIYSLGGMNHLNSNQFSASPNPFKNYTEIQIPQNIQHVNYTITSINGQVLIKGQHTGSEILRIDRNNLPSGMYFIQLENNVQYLGVLKLMISE